MIRRTVASLASILVLGAALAAPASAANSSTSPTVPAVGHDTPLGDDRLVDGEAPEVADGIGTARSRVTGVQFLAPDLDLRILDADTMSTLDHERAGVDDNVTSGFFAAASLALGDDALGRAFSSLGLPATVPSPAYKSQSKGGEHTEQFQQFPVLLPETDTPVGTVDWQETVSDVSIVAEYLCRQFGTDCSLGGAEPLNGVNALGLGQGDLVDGLLEPGRVQSRMGGEGGRTVVNSSLSELVMLSGLSILEDAGLGDLSADVTADAAGASTRGLKIASLDVLRLEALLDLLGLRPGQIPDPVLATMADALGINAVSLVADVKDVTSVEALYNSVLALSDDVSAQLTDGVTCDLLDPARLAAWAGEASNLGLTAPNCLGLGNLQTFLDSLERLHEDLVAALHNAMNDAALLRMEDLWASAGSSAEVGSDGRPAFGHNIKGGITNILVGSAPVTGLDLSDYADDWNSQEAYVNERLNEVLDILGPEFSDIVRIRLVPEWIEEHGVEEHGDLDYATARTRLVLAKVLVDTPDVNPAAVIARLQAEAAAAADNALDSLLEGVSDLQDDVVPELAPLELVAHQRPAAGGGADPGVLGQVVPGQSLTITVGEFEAEAEHTRPGVDIDCDASCDSSTFVTRVFDPETGRFVPALGGGDPGGSLPRTGGPGTWPIGVATLLTGSAWLLFRLTRRPTSTLPY